MYVFRPGTVGGYQPVYVVAAAPQPNTGNAYPGEKKINIFVIP